MSDRSGGDPATASGAVEAEPSIPSGWRAGEVATLAALADTFVPGDGPRRAGLAAAGLELALDPGQVRQLRLALRLVESPVANLALTGRPVRFSRLDPPARERYLLRWGRSRIALRRSAYQAFRRLLSFLAYAIPDEPDDPNPNLAAIGYIVEDPGLTATPTTVRPVDLPAGDPSAPVVLEADVVVVGSGASGGVVARALAEAGRSIVVLEAGPFVPEPEMPRAEVDAFDRLYLDHGLTATADGAVSILAGGAVGGGTTINWMTSIAAPDRVRSGWSRAHGIDGFDGPEGDADFAALAAELSVTESVDPPPKDVALLRGARALGLEAALTQRNAVDCRACGSCPFGCRAGAKQSGLRAHLAAACAAGARLVVDARVERVLIEAGRVAGVEATVGWEPRSDRARAMGVPPIERRTVEVRARQVVLAAGATRTPVILERSGIEHGALGRYLLLQPVSVVAGIFPESIEMWKGPLQGARSLAFVDGVRGRNGYAIESAPGHPGLIGLALPWDGRDAYAALGHGSVTSPRSSRSRATAAPVGSGRRRRAGCGSTTGSTEWGGRPSVTAS